jgi:hypothetical protein
VARGIVFSCAAAIVVFAVVQDRLTSDGVGRYETAYRAAAAGSGPPVTIDEIMKPAVRLGVQQGALWGGGVLVAGLGGTFAARRLRRRE